MSWIEKHNCLTLRPFRRFFKPFMFLAAVASVLVNPSQALSDELVEGQNTPAFQATVQNWLDGDDDLSVLRELSGLANDGNVAAQILLARLGSQSHFVQEVTQDLPRNERVALLRQPGGLSGKSWLEAASQTSPLARALLDSAERDARANAVGILFELGETAVATRAFVTLFNNGQGNLAVDIVNSGVSLPPEAAFFFAEMLRNGQTQANAYSGSAAIPRNIRSYPIPLSLMWAPIPPRTLLEDLDQRQVALEYTTDVPAFRPLADLCNARCPNEVAGCTAAGAAELWALDTMPFSSPSQVLIPDADYWTSARIQDDVLRRLRVRDEDEYWAYYESISSCFVSMMQGI